MLSSQSAVTVTAGLDPVLHHQPSFVKQNLPLETPGQVKYSFCDLPATENFFTFKSQITDYTSLEDRSRAGEGEGKRRGGRERLFTPPVERNLPYKH